MLQNFQKTAFSNFPIFHGIAHLQVHRECFGILAIISMKRRFRTRSEADCLTIGIKCSHFENDFELCGSYLIFLQFVTFSEVECKIAHIFNFLLCERVIEVKSLVKYVKYAKILSFLVLIFLLFGE